MDGKETILIADDADLNRAILRNLFEDEYNLLEAENGEQALILLRQYRERITVVLLDLVMPEKDGYEVLKEMQENRFLYHSPVIVITADDSMGNRARVFELGASDVIAKPFDLEVLTAKVQALLRRTYDFQGQAAFLEHRGALLRLGDPVLTYRDKRVELTRNEYKILQLLMENKGRVLSRELLMKHLWESESFIDDNTLTVNVARLRKKLEEMGLEDFIVTKKGLGYLVEA